MACRLVAVEQSRHHMHGGEQRQRRRHNWMPSRVHALTAASCHDQLLAAGSKHHCVQPRDHSSCSNRAPGGTKLCYILRSRTTWLPRCRRSARRSSQPITPLPDRRSSTSHLLNPFTELRGPLMPCCVRAAVSAAQALSPAPRAAGCQHQSTSEFIRGACRQVLRSPPSPPLRLGAASAAASSASGWNLHGPPPRQSVRAMASFPRSLDSHSADGQKAVAAAAER